MSAKGIVRKPKVLVAAGVTVGLAALAALFWFEPAQFGFIPPCQFHRLTGWNCPGCGSTRALHHLLHGRFATAFHCNPLLVLALPPLLWFGSRRVWSSTFGRSGATTGGGAPNAMPDRWFSRAAVWWWMLAVLIAFGVLRNLPGFAWMSP